MPVTEVHKILVTFRELSSLGRIQVAIVLTSVFFSTALVAAVNSEEVIRVTVCCDFVLALLGIAFTITYENQFAFGALVFLFVQQFVVLTLMMISSSSIPLPVRIVAPMINGAGMIGYAAMQVIARGTWGWHSWHAGLTEASAIGLFRRVQLAYAASVLAVGTAILTFVFVLFEHQQQPERKFSIVLASIVLAYTLLGAMLTAFVIIKRDASSCIPCAFLWVVSFVSACLLTAAYAKWRPRSFCLVTMLQLAVCVLVEGLVLAAVARLRPYFDSDMDLSHEREYMIDPTAVIHSHTPSRKQFSAVPVVPVRVVTS